MTSFSPEGEGARRADEGGSPKPPQKPHSAGMKFENPPTFSTKRTPFHPPRFEPCHNPPVPLSDTPGIASPAKRNRRRRARLSLARPSGPDATVSLRWRDGDGKDLGWFEPASIPTAIGRASGAHKQGAGPGQTDLVTKTAGAGANAKAPRARVRSGCAHIRREPETSRAPGQDVSMRRFGPAPG